METLVILYPGLDTELSLKHHVEILGYLKNSTVIIIEGYAKNVQEAHQKFETLIANYNFVEIQFEHSPLMLESARKRINENGYKVHINADLRYGHICLTVASFNKQQLKAAEAILKGDLTYEVLRIPDEIVINPEVLKGIRDSVSDRHQVSVDCINRSSGMLQISGFVNSDIASAYTTLLEKLFGITDYNTKISSTNHYIEESWQLDYEENSSQKVNVVLSGEMTYYLHKKVHWLTQVTKECISVRAPVKAVSLASSDDMKCTHTYKLEGKVSVLRGVIKEIQCLAKTFCCATERLVILTENARLMQKRWKQFKEKSESENDICIEFTIASYNYCCSSILRKELRSLSIVEFTMCGCNAEQITSVRQKIQSKENGLNLPVQKKPLSDNLFEKFQSLVAKEELCLDQKYPSAVIKLIPKSQSVFMKALSKEEIEQVYEDLILYLDSVPINALLNAIWIEAHYIPLLLSPEFENIATQIKKMHGIRIYPINISLLNNVVKQVNLRSSSGCLITVQLCYCNLLYEQVDAIVNCCRELSEDILVIGGRTLKLELDEYIVRHQVDPATNVCICCGSGYLPCKKVVHVFSSPIEEAFCSLQRALKCAQEHSLQVISFPSTGKDLLSAEKLMHEIQSFFIQNPNSCVHTIRIVCDSVQLINAYIGIKEFGCKEGVLDLPKSQPPLTPANHIFCQWY